jgi:pimeloyl-ACP methyl ester carboxylesterase
MAEIVPTDHWITLAAGRVFARQWPAVDAAPPRAPIVLLHDSLGCVELWRDFPALLAAATGRRVVAYDRLGFGRSDARLERPSRRFIAEEAATVFAALCEPLSLQRFVAIGHSVGGGMAIEIAAQWPERCAALVTMAAQALVEDRTLAGLRVAEALFRDPAQVERLARYHGDKAAWALDAWLGTWLDPAYGAWTLADVLPHVRCPVLAIHGADDEYGSARHPTLIGERAAGPARVEIMPGVGHLPHREQPARVLRLVAGFLADVA